jgi:peptidoglycan/xylan/chitin deacetylase (PgdA/CDA1 family)
MRINSNLHSREITLKAILGQMSILFDKFSYKSNELVVLNYHSTPKKFIHNFEHQLAIFQKHFDIINPSDLENYFNDKLVSKRPKLIYSFDDGLKNNLYAAQVLKKNNIQAFYFLVPDFIETKTSEQKQFYIKNIRPIINPLIDSEDEDFQALNWNEIIKLINEGNRIGSHTKSHTLISGKASYFEAQKEIVESKQDLERNTGFKISAFCSINNTLVSVGQLEKKLINENYKFHFTTLPGYNSINKSPYFIKRRNIECYWPDGAVYFALGKCDLARWVKKLELYEQL